MKPVLLTLLVLGLISTRCLGQASGKPAHPTKRKPTAKVAVKTPVKKRRPVAVLLTDANAEKAPAQLAVGDTLVLALDENPTTGYRWAVAQPPAKAQLRAAGDTYATKPADPQMVGVGGTRRLRFVAVAAGKTQLELHLRREWQKDNPDRRLRVTVAIK